MIALPPVPGSAPGVRAVADAVEATGRRLAAACADLVRLRDGAVWDGPAGSAFAARIGQVPGLLDRAARRHRAAAPPLRDYADVLEAEQTLAGRCVEEHAEAQHTVAVLEDRAYALVVAGRDESSPELLVVRALQREATAAMLSAEARHRGALHRLEAADRRCAAVLRALADDGLADSAVYRGLRATSRTGHGVGALAAFGRWAPSLSAAGLVGDAAGTVADAGLLVGYGEGRWSDVAAGAGLAATGFAGDSLRAGATAGAVRRPDGTVVVARLSAQERLVAGMSATARRRIAASRARFTMPPERGTASALLGGPAPRTAGSVAERARGAVRSAARARLDRVRGELSLVSAGGASTVRMYTGGVALQAAARAAPHTPPVRERGGGDR